MARQQHDAEYKPTGFVPTSLSLPDFNGDRPAKVPDAKTQLTLISEVSAPPEPGMNAFESFINEGSISLSSDMSNPTSIKILRGTGASQSFLLRDT